MPAKATLFDLKCNPLFDFGTGPRNDVFYNPQGNNILFWEKNKSCNSRFEKWEVLVEFTRGWRHPGSRCQDYIVV